VIVPTDTFLVVHHEEVIELAARFRLPAIYARHDYPSRRPDRLDDRWHGGLERCGHLVDRVLKGAKSGDLPVQAPTKFQLVINLKNRAGARDRGADGSHAARRRAD
jgi:putative ABC transport system substrate-binding protein